MGYFKHGHGYLEANDPRIYNMVTVLVLAAGVAYYYNTKSQGMRYARHAHFATGEESSEMTSVPFNMYEMREKLAEAEAHAEAEGYLGGFF